MIFRTVLSALALVVVAGGPALADDWTAVQLRGEVQQLVDHQWQPLKRGMVVSDSRLIRTLASARVTLTRGRETLDLGPNTQVAIHDRGTPALPDTTVSQYYGSVSVEAQVENVQHFSVETSTLAAVVKGTKFTVTSTSGAASVSVQRGHVAVSDKRNSSHVMLAVGQTATVNVASGAMKVSATVALPEAVPAGVRGDTKSRNVPGSAAGFGGGMGFGAANSNASAGHGNAGSGNGGSGNGNSGAGNGNGGANGSHANHGNGNG